MWNICLYLCVSETAADISVLMLPWLFKDDDADYMYVKNKNPLSCSPTLVFPLQSDIEVVETSFCRIEMDNMTVMVSEGGLNYIDLLAALMSVHYVYNVCYHHKLQYTMYFVQQYLMGFGATDLPPTVRKVANILFK